MQVIFYDFTKQKNSTMLPIGSSKSIDCKLKENTSILNPILLVSEKISTTYTYAYIADFNRYYYVTDIKAVTADLSEYYLEVDVLTTYATEIKNTTCQVAYSTVDFDPDLTDNRISVSNKKLVRAKETTSVLNETGSYILTLYNNWDPSNVPHMGGPVSVYIIPGDDTVAIANLCAMFDVQSVQDAITKFLHGDALRAVCGLTWVPVYGYDGLSTDEVVQAVYYCVGDVGYGVGSTHVGVLKKSAYKTFINDIDLHNLYFDGQQINDFRKASPYTTASLYLPGIGVVDVNLADWYDCAKMRIKTSIEYMTGNIQHEIQRYLTTGGIITVQQYAGNISAAVPLGQTITDTKAGIMAATALGGVALMAMTGGLGAGAAASAKAIAGGLSAKTMIGAAVGTTLAAGTGFALGGGLSSRSTASGSLGGRINTLIKNIIYMEYYAVTEDPNDQAWIDKYGRPNGKVCTLSTLAGGYVQTEGISISVSATEQERNMLNTFLDNGIYLTV